MVYLNCMYNERVRKPIRLKEYIPYNVTNYFVTVCVKEKFELFGEVKNNKMQLSELGKTVEEEIEILKKIRKNICINSYVVMPNHVHLIIAIITGEKAPSISQIIQQWKMAISKKVGFSPWQRSFHDHIIRDNDSHKEITEYINNNVNNWKNDCNYIKK